MKVFSFFLFICFIGFFSYGEASAKGLTLAQRTLISEKTKPYFEKEDYESLEAYFSGIQQSFEKGEIDDATLEDTFFCLSRYFDAEDIRQEKFLDRWIAAFPQSYPAHLFKGRFLLFRAGKIRGSKFRDQTTIEQFESSARIREEGIRQLRKSLELTGKPLLSLAEIIEASAGYDNPKFDLFSFSIKSERDTLLAQANKIYPQNIIARRDYINSFQPRWGGNYDIMWSVVADAVASGVEKGRTDFLEGAILLDMGDVAYMQDKYAVAMSLYKESYEKSHYFRERGAGTWALQRYIDMAIKRSESAGNQWRDVEILAGLNLLLDNPKYEDIGFYYGRRAYVRAAYHNDLWGAWSDYQEGTRKKDPFSMYKVAATYCQGAPGVVEIDRPRCQSLMVEAAREGSVDARKALKDWGMPVTAQTSENGDNKADRQTPIGKIVILVANQSLAAEEQAQLHEKLSKTFALPIEIKEVDFDLDLTFLQKRSQYHAAGILRNEVVFFDQKYPDDYYVVLVPKDIYMHSEPILFSHTNYYSRRSVISTFRMRTFDQNHNPVPDGKIVNRVAKLMLRPVGIMGGLESAGCGMMFPVDIIELDNMADYYCPSDQVVLAGKKYIPAPSPSSIVTAFVGEGARGSVSAIQGVLVLILGSGAILVLFAVFRDMARDLAKKKGKRLKPQTQNRAQKNEPRQKAADMRRPRDGAAVRPPQKPKED